MICENIPHSFVTEILIRVDTTCLKGLEYNAHKIGCFKHRNMQWLDLELLYKMSFGCCSEGFPLVGMGYARRKDNSNHDLTADSNELIFED